MAEWFARYPNDSGKYEITFRGTYEEAKIIEKACQNVIDKKSYEVGRVHLGLKLSFLGIEED